MTKLYIRVPKLGGKGEHWSHISTNAAGPTQDAEGLLNLKQPDLSWHRHVLKNYPDSNALRLRMKNHDWPELLTMAQVLGTPAYTYSVIGGSRPDYVPQGKSAYITLPEGGRFHDGSTEILPQPYLFNPYEYSQTYPYDRVIHIPDDTDPYYQGYDPTVFYPGLYFADDQPTIIVNDNGYALPRVLSGGAQPIAYVRKHFRPWAINPPQDITYTAPYFLFPKRLVAETQIMHVSVDLRWIRQHTAVPNIQAAEIVFTGFFSCDTGTPPVDFAVYLADSSYVVGVHEETISNPGNLNFYANIDPAAKVFAIGTPDLHNARNLFEARGSVLHSWNMYGNATRVQGNYAEGVFTYSLPISRVNYDFTDHMEFTLYTDPIPDPIDDTDFSDRFLGVVFSDVKVNLYN